MRVLNICLLTAALLLTGATSASAYHYYMDSNYTGPVAVDDTVIIDMHIDAEAGGQLLSFGILYDKTELLYNAVATTALPPKGPGTSGAEPSYILYTAGKPATALYPTNKPAWIFWPAPPTGKSQVNVNFNVTDLFHPITASGTNIYVATMLFDVIAEGDGTALIELCKTCGGNVLRINNVTIDPATIPVTGTPITVTVPEPAITSLGIAACVACVYLARRRRRV